MWGGDADNDTQVTEVSPQGQVVWQWQAKPHLGAEKRYELAPWRKEPYSYTHTNAVTRLASGNTLVSLRNFHMVVALTPEGNIVWKQGELTRVHDPHLLPNGNLLGALLERPNYCPVREITRSGKVVWEYAQPGLTSITTVQVLPNDNVLIAGRTLIVEVTRDKEVVWQARLPEVAPLPANQDLLLYKVVRLVAK